MARPRTDDGDGGRKNWRNIFAAWVLELPRALIKLRELPWAPIVMHDWALESCLLWQRVRVVDSSCATSCAFVCSLLTTTTTTSTALLSS